MISTLQQQYRGFIETPSLFEEDFFGIQPFHLPQSLEKINAEVFDIPEKLVLGKRAEHFFAQAIQSSSTYELLAQNLQVIQDKKTWGEFDFFLKNLQLNQKLHVELVYKFYLYNPSFDEEMERWIGPNRKDSLLRKINRLKSHQLPLLFQQEAQETLVHHELNPKEFQQRVCFKATLFVPKNLKNHTFPTINSACIAGFWLHQEQFSAEDYGSFQYFTPQKKDWPVDPALNLQWKSFETIQSEIQVLFQHQKSALLWMKKSEQVFERFFVVWW